MVQAGGQPGCLLLICRYTWPTSHMLGAKLGDQRPITA